MSSGSKPSDGRQGMILVVVLWAIAMMTVAVVALSAYAQKSVGFASLEADQLRTTMALNAGIEIGEALILERKPADRVFFDGTEVMTDIGGGRQVSVSVMDASGLADINRAKPELLEALAKQASASSDGIVPLVAEILKLREAQQKDNAPATGEAPKPPQPQQTQQPAKEAAADEEKSLPALFYATAQLYGLAGAEPEAVDKLLPLISLYSSDGKINPMVAPRVILNSIPDLTPAETGTLLQARSRQQWNTKAVQAVLAEHKDYLAIGESRVFIVEVTARGGPGLLAGRKLQATVLFDESDDGPFQVLAWSW